MSRWMIMTMLLCLVAPTVEAKLWCDASTNCIEYEPSTASEKCRDQCVGHVPTTANPTDADYVPLMRCLESCGHPMKAGEVRIVPGSIYAD